MLTTHVICPSTPYTGEYYTPCSTRRCTTSSGGHENSTYNSIGETCTYTNTHRRTSLIAERTHNKQKTYLYFFDRVMDAGCCLRQKKRSSTGVRSAVGESKSSESLLGGPVGPKFGLSRETPTFFNIPRQTESMNSFWVSSVPFIQLKIAHALI